MALIHNIMGVSNVDCIKRQLAFDRQTQRTVSVLKISTETVLCDIIEKIPLRKVLLVTQRHVVEFMA